MHSAHKENVSWLSMATKTLHEVRSEPGGLAVTALVYLYAPYPDPKIGKAVGRLLPVAHLPSPS
jgi:hypothetical protein